MSLYMWWPLTNFYTFSFFFCEIVMRTRHPGGNGNFSPGKILAWGEITISPRVTSAHDDFTEKKWKGIEICQWPSHIIFIDSYRNMNFKVVTEIVNKIGLKLSLKLSWYCP